MSKSYIVNLIFIISSFLFGCDDSKAKYSDTPTSGKIKIVADESYQPIIDSELQVFHSQYPDAKIEVTYKPAIDVLNSFLDDSVRMIITSRYPDTNQLEEFKRVKGYMPQRNIIGKDALAIVAHSAHGTLKITDDELKQILLGKITKFEQLENSKISGTIKLVFNSDKSSEILYVQDSLLSGQPIGNPSVFATKNNVAVMDYVAQNKEALGIVGVSWVSDEYSDQVQKFKESVTLVQIKKDKAHYYEPHLGYIATHDYPYRKYICVTNKEGSMGLGRGFLQFMSGDIGQKIIMKAGVVPAFAQPRVLSVQD